MNATDAPASRGTTRNRGLFVLVVLSLSGFVTSFGAHIVATNLPTYAQSVGVGAFMIGVLIAVYDFAELFAKPVAGFVADKRGMKTILLAGLVVFIAGSLLFLVIRPSLLVLVRFTQGLGAAALSTVSISLVARYFSENRGRSLGIYNAIKGAGYVIAPAAGGFLASRFGFSMLFLVSAAIGAFVLVLSLFLPGDTSSAFEDDDDASLKDFVAIFADRALRPMYAVIVINMFMVGALFGFLPVYLHGLGYSSVRSGTVLSVSTAAYLLIQPVAGMLADRFDIRTTVMIGLALSATAIMVMTFTSGWPLIGVVIAAGFGIGTVWTNSDTMVAASASRGKLGASIGAAQSFKEFGDMVGPLVIGAITQLFSVRIGFVTCGLIGLSCLLVLSLGRTTQVRDAGQR